MDNLPTASHSMGAAHPIPPAVTALRPTTSGKSIEYLAKLGLVPMPRRVKLLLKRSRESMDEKDSEYAEVADSDREEREEHEDDGMEGDDDDDEFVIDVDQRPKKKRRIVSAHFVDDSEDDIPGRRGRARAKPRTLNDWPTYPSPNPCPVCVSSRAKCRTFVLYPEGWKNQKQRRSCTNCYLKKRACVFNRIYKEEREEGKQAKGKASGNTKRKERPDTDGEKPKKKGKSGGDEEGKQKTTKGKGKGKATDDADDADRDVDREAGDDRPAATQRPRRQQQARYRSVRPNEAGPSTNRRIQSEERPGDIAEMCARLNEVREEVRGLQNVTMERFSLVDQNIDRLDSNIDTQRTFFTQEMKSTQMTAQTAFDQSSENRQSINQILEYSGQTATFMSALMDRLANLRFDLPNALDQWASTRFGDQPGPSTVTASQLYHSGFQSSTPSIPIPRMQLPLINLPRDDQRQPPANAPLSQNPKSHLDPQVSSMPSQGIPSQVWKEFIHSSSSGEETDRVAGRSGQHQGTSSQVKIELADEHVAEWPPSGVEDDGPSETKPVVSADTNQDQSSGMDRMAVEDKANVLGSSTGGDDIIEAMDTEQHTVQDDPIEDFEPAAGDDDPIQTNSSPAASSQSMENNSTEQPRMDALPAEQPLVDEDHPMSDSTGGHEDHGLVNADEPAMRNIPPPIDTPQPPECDHRALSVVGESVGRQSTIIEDPATILNVIPPTPVGSQSGLRSSPSIVTSTTVHPPPGLLADEVDLHRRAASSVQMVAEQTLRPGPVTRSRSGSRSTGSEAASRAPSVPPRKPKSKAKRRSNK